MYATPLADRYVLTKAAFQSSRWDIVRNEAATIIAPRHPRTPAIERLDLAG